MESTTEVTVAGRRLQFSNLQKVFYPEAGFTKQQVIDYYRDIAPALLPHLKNRPLTLKRYPGGVTGEFFYEKRCPGYRPPWLKIAPVQTASDTISFCLANDLPSLLWAANLAVLELHTSLSLARDPDTPTLLVFDLDPGPPAGLIACAEVALWLRDFLAGLRLQAFPKTSGSKGLQIYVPLNTPTTYLETKTFAHTLARRLEQQHPDKVLSVMKKHLRAGKVFVDWSQNDRHKTTVCVYSLRAREQPTVSAPVTWDEVRSAWRRHNPAPLTIDSAAVLKRVAKHGDLFAPVLELKQKLPTIAWELPPA
jgi:bifunctional non-homologous end joining protein LigD